MEQMEMMDEDGYVDEYEQDFEDTGAYEEYEEGYPEEAVDEGSYPEEITEGNDGSYSESAAVDEENIEFEFIETDE